MKTCALDECSEPFLPNRSNQIFCSQRCRRVADKKRYPTELRELECENDGCGKTFTTTNRSQKYCSAECCKEKTALDSRGGRPNLASGTTGAVSELYAGMDLMLKGWETFRALSPACSCDLIAQREGVSIRVEVRTGAVSSISGKITWPRNGDRIGVRGTKRRSEDVLDHYAVVYWQDGKPAVLYDPPLPE